MVATLHGYAAAWLAVRMLFRPRHPVKVLGITIWPQGMIPRHRQRLAETIGRAVGTELVSQETVVSALFDTDFFRHKVEAFVASYTNGILSAPYPSLIEALPPRLRAPVLDAIAALQRHIADYVADLLKSPQMETAVHDFVDDRIDDLLARRLRDAINDNAFKQIIEFVEGRFRAIATEPGFEAKLRAFIGARLDELAHSQAPLAEILTPDAVAIIKERIDQQVPPVVHQLAEIATSLGTRKEIGSLIKREVDEYYGQISFFKKIFVSRDRIHREVDDLVNKTLPHRIEEYLHGEAFEQQAKDFLAATIDSVLARPISDIIGQIESDKLETIKNQITQRILALVRGPELAANVSSYASDALARLRPHSLRALLEHLEPDSAERLKNLLSNRLLDIIRREETARAINQILSAQIERLLVVPIGRPTDLVPVGSIKRASEALTERITEAARERLPTAITEFDIGGIVRRKVADYPAEKLENLVLSVAQQHLRTIELFGLVIGFFIGIFQAFYFWYMR
ncbi:MAG: DUF445 family protein [Pyrinomonadaceae bacterium]|nr:DUF445 family protein [Pyrinomonadaceae bacterium]